jgi:hypothetical protein
MSVTIGIDGNMWYCSDGGCLGDPDSQFAFERTLREAITTYQKEFKSPLPAVPEPLAFALDLTPEQYNKVVQGE